MITYTITLSETATVYEIQGANICLGPCRHVSKEGCRIAMRPQKRDHEFRSLLVNLFMGLHPRLGEHSPLQTLDHDLLVLISNSLLSSLTQAQKVWDLKPNSGGHYTMTYPYEGEAFGNPGPPNVFKGMRICSRCNDRFLEQCDELDFSQEEDDRIVATADMARDCMLMVEKLEKHATWLNPPLPARLASCP